MNWMEWLASDDGKRCADYSTLSGAEYLKNRLWWAYQAGLDQGVNLTPESSPFEISERTAEGKPGG